MPDTRHQLCLSPQAPKEALLPTGEPHLAPRPPAEVWRYPGHPSQGTMGHRWPGAPSVPRATAASLPVVRGNPADRGSEAQRERPPLWNPTAHSPATAQRSPRCPQPPEGPRLPSPSGRQGADAALPPGPDSGPQAADREAPLLPRLRWKQTPVQATDRARSGFPSPRGPSGEGGCFGLSGGQTRKRAM